MSKSVITIVFTALFLVSCHQNHKSHNKLLKLEVSTPIKRDTTITREYVCQIHAKRHIELKALEKGYLQKIFVDEGQFVKKGQPMFKIMPNVYEAHFQKVRAEVNITQIEYDNTKALADKNVVSKNELALSKANLDKAKAELKLAETHLSFTNINAPFNGIMDHLEAREGSLLEEGELLTKLSDNHEMWVYFNVPEAEYLDYVSHNGEKQKEVELKTANGKIFEHVGVIGAIEGEFNNKTGNIEFRATFPNPKRILRHGQTGSILMKISVPEALLIPQKATFEVLDKQYVFVVTKENKLEQRNIKISHELAHFFIVSEGLEPSDRILLQGLRKVRNKQSIEPVIKSPQEILSDLKLHAE